MNSGSTTEIHLGAPLTAQSERVIIEHIQTGFEAAGTPALILANFQVGGRQLDCVVVTDHSVWLVEAKSSALPIRGQINGEWHRLLPTGSWDRYRNAYQQALEAKNRLRDAMSGYAVIGDFYPQAAVVFTNRSSLHPDLTPGDFKVHVCREAEFQPWESARTGSPWSLSVWRQFAASLGLVRVSAREALGTGELSRLLEQMRQVSGAAAADYSRDGERWIPESESARAAILESLSAAPGSRIVGPTGCGKSLIAKWFAADRASQGQCAILLRCKDFAGSWARLVERELALLTDVPPRDLYRAVRAHDAPSYLVLDGVNEIGGDREEAIRSAAAMCRRFGLRLIVTDQLDQDLSLAGMATVKVEPPSRELKVRIAASYGRQVDRAVESMLLAAKSGFEAAIIGEIGAASGPVARQVLVDQYMRKRLGEHARRGTAALRELALQLHSTLAYSISEIAFDDMMVRCGLSAEACEAMFGGAILVRRSGRISFRHEMMLRASVAHALGSQASKLGDAFATLLDSPLFQAVADDVIAVIEDGAVCRRMLSRSGSAELLHRAVVGEMGEIAATIAQVLLNDALSAVEREIEGLRLEVKSGDKPALDFEAASTLSWSREEGARLGAVTYSIDEGRGIERYLDLCGKMDDRLLSERQRLLESCKESGIRNPRSQAFWLAYFSFGRDCGFAILARNIRNSSRAERLRFSAIRFDIETLSSGQLHFYLERRHSLLGDDDADLFARQLIYLCKSRYRTEPYHVQLAIMEAAGFSRGAKQELVDALVAEINAILSEPGPDNGALDALKFLGALDESAEMSRSQIWREVAAVTGKGDDEVVFEQALALTVSMFDHPFDYVYYEVVHDLPEEQRRLILRRAIRAGTARQSMNFGYLAREIAMFDDAGDMELMQQIAMLPDPANVFPQSEWEGFVIATRYLGRHRMPLPERTDSCGAGECIEALRSLVHALEGGATRSVNAIWRELEAMPPWVVAGCLYEMDTALSEGSWRQMGPSWPPLQIMAECPGQCLSVARGFLASGEDAGHFHRGWAREATADYAFQCLERHGDRSDLGLLRRLITEGRHTKRALAALSLRDTVA